MIEVDDAELLRRYAKNRSEEAFAELLRRHLDLVFSAASRIAGSDRAQDVAQHVFLALARKAPLLSHHSSVAGWLYVSAHHSAAALVRAENRRQAREEEAYRMKESLTNSEDEVRWEQLRPVLDDVLQGLKKTDREAVLLRFFEHRPFAEIGAALRLNEDAARKRVDRALEKLRAALARRGITSSGAALALLLEAQGVFAAPAGLAGTIAGSASAIPLASSAGGVATLKFLTTANIGLLSTMKLSTLVLTCSIAANAVFVVYAARSVSTSPVFHAEVPERADVAGAMGSASGATAPTSRAGARNTVDASSLSGAPQTLSAGIAGWTLSPKAWNAFLGGDLHDVVARMRAAGFPISAISHYVGSRLGAQFAERLQKLLLPAGEDGAYWKPHGFSDPKTVAAVAELRAEWDKLRFDYLGRDAIAYTEDARALERYRYGDLPSEKMDQVRRIAADYADLQTKIYAQAHGVMLPEDREKLALLQQELRADVSKLLTPDELMDYDLLASPTADLLRRQLTIFDPTEKEYRDIFDIQRAFDQKYPNAPGATLTSEQIRERIAAQQLLQANIQAALGSERAAAYQQAIDPANQQLNRLTQRLGLPVTAAMEVAAAQREYLQRSGVLSASTDLAPDDRSGQLDSLAQQTTARITAALGGQRGLEAYKLNGGAWLKNLQSRTTPAKTP